LSISALFILLGLLLIFPLVLRFFTARHMRLMRERAFDRDEEFRQLKRELETLLDKGRQIDRQHRHYALRGARLRVQIEEARGELERLRIPAAKRMAA